MIGNIPFWSPNSGPKVEDSYPKPNILQMILVPQLDVIEVGEGMDMVHSEEAVPAVTLLAGTNKDQQLMVDTTENVAGVCY